MSTLGKFTQGELPAVLGGIVSAGEVPCIWGQPGTGKTAIGGQFTEAIGAELIVVHPAAMADSSDLTGIPVPDKRGEAVNFLPFGVLKKIVTAEKPAICFIDDVGQAPLQLQAPIMQLLEARHINGQQVPDCVRFILASNDTSDRAGVSRMISPLENRLIHLEITVSLQDWLDWGITKIIPEIQSFHKFNGGEFLHKFDSKSTEKGWPSCRSWEKASKCLTSIPRQFHSRILPGIVGQAATAAYTAFLSVYMGFPSVAEIIADPVNSPLPDGRPGLEYALAFGLVRAFNAGTSQQIIQYIDRLNDPAYFLAVLEQAGKKNPCIYQGPGIVEFLQRNSVLISSVVK